MFVVLLTVLRLTSGIGASGKLGAVQSDSMHGLNLIPSCIALIAWSRMTSSLPVDTPGQIARVEKFRQRAPAKIDTLVI